MAQIVSIQVGLPQTRGHDDAENPMERTWTSSIYKYPVEGAVWMGKINIEGDKQSDLRVHGGEDKAVMLYALEHYDYWRTVLPDIEWVNGGFGENLTVDGMNEETVCIGDVYAIGEARVEVTQPREPCWKLARRWMLKDLTALVDDNGYSGWYVRVLKEGQIEAGMEMVLEKRPHPEWTIAYTKEVMHRSGRDPEFAAVYGVELANLPQLAESWRSWLLKKAAKAEQ